MTPDMAPVERQTTAPPEHGRTRLVSAGRPELGTLRLALIDKNLAALGFFTPSSHRIKREKAKTVRLSSSVDGLRTEASATIVPSALHGLPITADQDKFLALQTLIHRQRRPGEPVINPVRFSSAALLETLGLCDSGRNHLDVSDWLDVMASTTIISEGAVYLSGHRRWARDRFRVFDRAVSRGQQLEDGQVATCHHVWLSAWQLQNINGRYLLPIDLTVYQALRTHIGRALVLHLQIWLYASQRAGAFEKRYTDICQLLSLRVYDHRSKIVEKLGPALEELATSGFLATWQVARTADDRDFKLVLAHGPLFRGEPSRRSNGPSTPQPTPSPADLASRRLPTCDAVPDRVAPPDAAFEALTARGITARRARQLLDDVTVSSDVLRQIEWGDFVIGRAPAGTFWNPAGFYIALVRDRLEPPAYFLSSHQRAEREEAREAVVGERSRRQHLNDAYQRYREHEAVAHLATMDAADREAVLRAEGHDIRARFPSMTWTPESLRRVAEAALRTRMAAELPLLDFRTFVERMAESGGSDGSPAQEA